MCPNLLPPQVIEVRLLGKEWNDFVSKKTKIENTEF
jgi:hypothetical protein